MLSKSAGHPGKHFVALDPLMPSHRSKMQRHHSGNDPSAAIVQQLSPCGYPVIVRHETRPLEKAEPWQIIASRRRIEVAGDRHEQHQSVEHGVANAASQMIEPSEWHAVGRLARHETPHHAYHQK